MEKPDPLCRQLERADGLRIGLPGGRVDAADASLEQVRIGLLEFRAGRTTAFELVRLAGDVATAQQRYSSALVRAAKTAADSNRRSLASAVVRPK